MISNININILKNAIKFGATQIIPNLAQRHKQFGSKNSRSCERFMENQKFALPGMPRHLIDSI